MGSNPTDVGVPPANITGYVTTTPPRSPRAAIPTNMTFSQGYVATGSDRSIQGRYKGGNRVRFHKGYPEKILGWQPVALSGSNGGTYVGTVRGVWDWASLDGQEWIAFGTECKLYLVNNATLYDITPVRKVSNLTNALSTVNTSHTVTVHDPDNYANAGDHIVIPTAVTVGGITLQGDYDIVSFVDPDHYTITAATAATSTVTNGGGSVTINYQISCGLADNGEIYGYGTGQYGMGTYGTPRPTGDGVQARMRIWSLYNWGEDLVASYSDGEIYWWDRSNGPNQAAVLVDPTAPTDVQRILVNPDLQFLLAFGASDVITGTPDKMNIRWPSQSSLTDWIPVLLPTPNTAGGQRMNYGDRMVAALNSNGATVAFSDTQVYQMQYVGQPNIFGFTARGKCYIVGANAAIDVNGTVYFMGFDDFYIFNGVVSSIPCDVWEYVFNDFDRTQCDAVFCSSYFTKNEVMWLYPAASVEETRYVVFNYMENCWYYGVMPRTAYHDVSPALTGFFEYPYGFNDGVLYQHEIGYDEVEPGDVTNAMDWYLESWDIGANFMQPMLINSIVPDFPITEGNLQLIKGMQVVFKPKEYPTQQQSTGTSLPAPAAQVITPTTTKFDVRVNGTQTAMRLEAARATWTDESGTHTNAIVYGQWFRLGLWQALATPYGKRIGGATIGDPIDTSGP